ncbi:hypothetical protein PF008_g12998 [Phytophthora fragariae]|uniref:Uncharacterized protein n=1 Tax=Phytophthora fragariae TaxID=53985 RepID=A0A6G0RL79_9STRA|nr:hypothetical protein PF008_g12998 [Phytophthora fragariae]
MDKKRPKKSAGRRGAPVATPEATFPRHGSWKQRSSRSSSVLWLKLNFTIKAARLQTLKRQKYQHLQEEALLKARGLLKNWEDGPVLLTEDLYSRARTEHDAQELINYTPEALALRFSLRNHPDVIDAVKQLWAVELPRDEMGCIDQNGYASLFRRIGRCLEPDATKRRLRRMEKTIQEDWRRDSKGEPVMAFANFFDSVFELADLWCETIDVDEYIAFLRTLVLRVSTVRRAKQDPNSEERRLLRPLTQIKAIDNDEESSSSEEELAPLEVVDDVVELSSGDDESDEDEEEDAADLPAQLPPPTTATHSMGFIATKVLQTFRAKTPPPPQIVHSTPDPVPEDRPRSRDRRASIITLGLGGLGGFAGFAGNDKEAEQNTLRGSSAKSRTTSARSRTPLTSVREFGLSNAEADEGVNAFVAMHRLRSAQPRTPVIVEDAPVSSAVPNSSVSLTIGRPIAALHQQKPQRQTKLFTAALGAPKTGQTPGVAGLPAGGLHGTLTSSAPQLTPANDLKSGASRGGSQGARRSNLPSSRTQQRGDRGVIFEGSVQTKVTNKRLTALAVGSAKPSQSSSDNQEATGKKVNPYGAAEEEESALKSLSNDTQSEAHGPREYVSGMGFDTSGNELTNVGAASRVRNRADVLPVNPSLPFYTFEDNASPAKRLLPPVLVDSGIRGRSGARSGKSRRRGQGSAGRGGPGPDFSESYKTTGYLTGSLQAEIIARTQWNVAGSRSVGERALQQGATPLWFPLPGKEFRSHSRQSSSNLTLKKPRNLSPDDGYNDFTVSPWDAEFDHEPDDDLARAVPPPESARIPERVAIPAVTAPVSPTTPPTEQEEVDPAPPTISVVSSMVPLEPPSCVSELTTLPMEYHELVLGGSSISSYKGLSKTSSAPLSPTAAMTVPVKIPSREPQWMLHDAAKPPRTLLEDGVEGRTVAGSSPRSIFTALTSKRPRRERDADGEEDDSNLCPRFVEHLEMHGDRSATAPSPLFRTEKTKPRCTCNDDLEGDNDDLEFSPQCPRHGSLDNNRKEEGEQEEDLPQQESQVEDVTVIVNATRGLVLRPGSKDRLAAKRARYTQQATRSQMMRRRCQYTFAKHLD